MLEFVFSFFVLLLAFAGLGLGRLGGKRGICGSCGGLGKPAGNEEGACSLSDCPVLSLREMKKKKTA